jgi:hypothetical protein
MRTSVLLVLAICSLTGCSSYRGDMFPEWKDLDEFPRGWYSNQLVAANESPIVLPIETPTYRFIWIRTFHNPVVVRVECPGRCKLSAKILSGEGGYDPGKVSKFVRRNLSQDEEDKFKQLMSRVNFSPAKRLGGIVGLDGAQWILEAASGNTYRALDYWRPVSDKNSDVKAYVALCNYMIDLSGFEIPSDEFY